MRAIIAAVILFVSGLMGLAAVTRRNETPTPNRRPTAQRQGLVVHEWGTFTNFSGSDGIQLEFRPLVDQDLPPFVYDRAWQSSGPFGKGRLVARQRMETPVTYFYSNRKRELTVRVDFPQGLLTEFYPPAIEMTPRYISGEQKVLRNSSLSWKISVLPPASTTATSEKADGSPVLPPVKGDDHYGFARDTDSAVVRAVDHYGIGYDEKFLFYRGVGNFALPLRLEALPERRFRIVNDGRHAIESLFCVLIDEEGLHFCQHASVQPNSALEAVVPGATSTSDELGNRMAEALVAAGLYEKEATAMIRTWQSSWFTEPGARLFYLVPRRLTDEIIPLSVEPAPDEMVRVLVGRMESLTPEAADRLTSVVKALGTCMLPAAEPLRSELERLGRFAEPALAYLKSHESDAATREELELLYGLCAAAAKR